MKPKYTHIGNVVLVGTSHIADEAVKNVKAVIEEFNPCIVGVELDKQRFRALLSQQKSSYFPSINNIRRFGVKGTIFALIGG